VNVTRSATNGSGLFIAISIPSFRNMHLFNKALMGNTTLFQIETILSAPEILLQPKSNELYKLLMNCVRNCVDGTKVGR